MPVDASHVPTMSVSGASAAGSRFALRRKGQILFLLVSLYVVSGVAVLGGQALALTRGRQEDLGRIEPLIWVALVVVLLGLVVFGAFLTLFLGRLAADLGRVQARALQVAAGYRGAPLLMTRDDEVGALATAVDKLAADLKERETQIAAAQVEQFHAERMTLLGGIAAGLAHEIGNPVAGIVAITSQSVWARSSGPEAARDAEQLRKLAERLARVTRRFALAAGLRSTERAPTALNPVLESVIALVALDERFRGAELSIALDPLLPAVVVAEDDVVQLLLHLLVNCAESFAGARTRRPTIRVETSCDGNEAVLRVRDTGCGMDAETLKRAFEPLFTTKPAGKGNGLGLDACRRIMQRNGGSIVLYSTPGEGTDAECRFPLPAAGSGGPL